MIDHLPCAAAIAGEIVGTVRGMRVVHEEDLLAIRVTLASEQSVQTQAVDDMALRWRDSGYGKNGGKEIVNRRLLLLDRSRRNRQSPLMRVVGRAPAQAAIKGTRIPPS